MQEPVNDDMFPTRIQQPDYWVMISDLMSLIERIRTSMQIASDSQGCEETEDNFIVLNDVPQDSLHHDALNNCCLQLREALNFMLEARSSEPSSQGSRQIRQWSIPAAATR
jgi:hypothetical protein